ncbi:MAG: ATP-binding protein [Acidobacteria bacterium]|nr:ATP-binding protein [Acidobacteriota bacterium]
MTVFSTSNKQPATSNYSIMRLSLSGRLLLLALANLVVTALGVRYLPLAIALFIAVLFAVWSARNVAARVTRPLAFLADGVRGFRDRDFSMRLAVNGNDEVSDLIHLYNEVGDVLRKQRGDIVQKELLLDTILQRTPVGVVLINALDRVAYSNTAGRELFAGGARLDGRHFDEIAAAVAQPLREALAAGTDVIFSIGDAPAETFHLTQRTFHLNTQPHRLVLLERLTPELRRQEVGVWKNAIRLMNHELNNSIAPISSLFHSARHVEARPELRTRLGEIYDTIEERLEHLRDFLESYAAFARLPPPRKTEERWPELLDEVHALYPFRIDGALPESARFDRAQLQQVLINLVKNAHESGSDPSEIAVSVRRLTTGTIVRVSDRGPGMPAAVLRQALLPFYSTKPNGTGLGLALSNEILEAHGGRLHLQAREGGGTVVTCWLGD